MDKRLIHLLINRGGQFKDGCMIDTYNQQIQQDVSCTILTSINKANHHFIVEIDDSLETPKIISMPHGYNKGSIKDIAPTCTANAYQEINFIIVPQIAAMRGRNPDNPSEIGRSNGNYKQRLEVNENGTSNTLTSLQKDNLVIEPTIIDVSFVENTLKLKAKVRE